LLGLITYYLIIYGIDIRLYLIFGYIYNFIKLLILIFLWIQLICKNLGLLAKLSILKTAIHYILT